MRKILILISAILIASCGGDIWEAEVPTYLNIAPFEFTTFGDQGANTSDIRDVWVYDNNELLGAFELPAQVPLIGRGEKQIVVFPGIRENGNTFFPDIYFLYEPDTFIVNADGSSEITIEPETIYDERTKFSFVEDFESGNIFTLDLDEDDTTRLVTQSETVRSGGRAGLIRVNEEFPSAVVATAQSFGPFFKDGPQAYLEFDFKSNVPLTVGYFGIANDGENFNFLKVTLLPQEEWKKVYVEFTEEFLGDDLRLANIIFRVDLDQRLSSATEGETFIDNVKLVHF